MRLHPDWTWSSPLHFECMDGDPYRRLNTPVKRFEEEGKSWSQSAPPAELH
jgi:hypothetical protein